MKIARLATVPFFLYNHLRNQITATIEAGHDVTLISSEGPETEWLKKISGVKLVTIDIPRKISPTRDIIALWKLFRFFRKEKFDIVHSTTPKAGMLSAIASRLAGTPIRLHTFTGQAWVEMSGLLRIIAKAGDWLTARLNTLCYADSHSQMNFIVEERVCLSHRINVIGAGSLSGVDLSRFSPDRWKDSRKHILQEIGIPPDSLVISFIGRITRDKGVNELLSAFALLRDSGFSCTLLMIGPVENSDGSFSDTLTVKSDPAVRFIGYTQEPERFLSVTDIFCLPSYREGFGNVIIEAAAMGVPSIGTDIVGLRNSIVNGETGILVPTQNVKALEHALKTLLTNENKRKEMGSKAQARARQMFSSECVTKALLEEYARLHRKKIL